MSHMAPGEGSPVDNPNAVPMSIPYEPQQGTGEAEISEEEVQRRQEGELAAREAEDPEAEEQARPAHKAKHKKK
jgi:hypothetical protein